VVVSTDNEFTILLACIFDRKVTPHCYRSVIHQTMQNKHTCLWILLFSPEAIWYLLDMCKL